MTIGHDTNLYRSAADTLKTDDSFIVDGASFTVNSTTMTLGDAATDTLTINAGPVNFPNATSAADALTLSTDVVLYRSAANTLTVDDNFIINFNGGKTTLALTNTTADVGLTIGADTNLYRSAANTLKTDDSLIVDVNLTANGNATLGDATTDTHIVNGTLTNNLPDNTATALDFKESTNSYLKLATTNSSELVTIGATPKFTSLNTTDATNSTTAAATFVGGVGIAKKLYVGTDFNVNGNTVLGDAYTDTVLITGKLLRGILTYNGASVTTQASSTSINADKVIVTGAVVANGSLSLPAAIAGMEIEVKNRAGQSINIYANSSPGTDRIFDSSILITNATALTLANNTNKNFVCAPSGGINVWFT
jgi:hypothetical protein